MQPNWHEDAQEISNENWKIVCEEYSVAGKMGTSPQDELRKCRLDQKSILEGIEGLKRVRQCSCSIFKINRLIRRLENSLSYLKDAERILQVRTGENPAPFPMQKREASYSWRHSFLFAAAWMAANAAVYAFRKM